MAVALGTTFIWLPAHAAREPLGCKLTPRDHPMRILSNLLGSTAIFAFAAFLLYLGATR